jgi:hypothetical protein
MQSVTAAEDTLLEFGTESYRRNLYIRLIYLNFDGIIFRVQNKNLVANRPIRAATSLKTKNISLDTEVMENMRHVKRQTMSVSHFKRSSNLKFIFRMFL